MTHTTENTPIEGITFFKSYYEGAKELSDKQRLAYYDGVFSYAFLGEMPDLTGLASGFFKVTKPNIDQSIKMRLKSSKASQAKLAKSEKDVPTITPTYVQTVGGAYVPEKISTDKDRDKDKRKERDLDLDREGETELESATAATATPTNQKENNQPIFTEVIDGSPIILYLPLLTGDFFAIHESKVQRWGEQFPSVDIVRELRQMSAWLEANPDRQKKAGELLSFVVRWLSKEEKNPQPTKSNYQTPQASYSQPQERGFLGLALEVAGYD